MKLTEILNEIIEEEKINLLLELFDKIGELPENLRQEGNIFYFEFDNHNYFVEFKEFNKDYRLSRTITDDNKKIINKIPDGKYVLEFGVIINGKYISTIDLKNSNSIKVFNYIVSIIDYFMKTNILNLINFIAEGKRLNIYLKIFDKIFSKEYVKLENDIMKTNILYVKNKFV